MEGDMAGGFLRRLVTCIAGLVVSAGVANAATIWSFNDTDGRVSTARGASPPGGLIERGGVFYGVTQVGGAHGGGVAFRLTPPPAGQTAWKETVLYDFASLPSAADGQIPDGPLYYHSGAYYGVTLAGGAYDRGTVYKLTPPLPGQKQWTHQILYSFPGGASGSHPNNSITMDASGDILGIAKDGGQASCSDRFGVIAGCGLVYMLTPPSIAQTNWTETVLYAFPAGGANGGFPASALILWKGSYFGATSTGGAYNQGTVYSLTPPTSTNPAWSEQVIHSFGGPNDGQYMFAGTGLLAYAGAIWGTTSFGGSQGQGAVYKLTPPAKSNPQWTEKVVYSFCSRNPVNCNTDATGYFFSGLIVKNGVLYGASEGGGKSVAGSNVGCGTVFKLTPDSASSTGWTESIDYAFVPPICPYAGPSPVPGDGVTPASGLLSEGGAVFGLTADGGNSRDGSVFEVGP
jgi:uncharacterized repeat protein (TIGR03803 family)